MRYTFAYRKTINIESNTIKTQMNKRSVIGVVVFILALFVWGNYLRIVEKNTQLTFQDFDNDGLYFEQNSEWVLKEGASDSSDIKNWERHKEPGYDLLVTLTPDYNPDAPVLRSRMEGSAVKEPVKIEMETVCLNIPERKVDEFKVLIFCDKFHNILEWALAISIYILAYVLHDKIKNGAVFSDAMSGCFKWAGTLMISVFFIEWFLDCYAEASSGLRIAYHSIRYVRPDIFLIVIGVFLILISLIIKRAKAIKEENELTI